MDAVLLGLADTLLPGGAGFPPFSATQADAVLVGRVPAELWSKLLAALGAPPAGKAAWVAAAARIEALEPALFSEVRKQVYLAYYEQPGVITAIRALGHPYNDAPLPDGYPTEPFDPATDAPRHGRGRWTDTDAVHPVDLTGLEHLR